MFINPVSSCTNRLPFELPVVMNHRHNSDTFELCLVRKCILQVHDQANLEVRDAPDDSNMLQQHPGVTLAALRNLGPSRTGIQGELINDCKRLSYAELAPKKSRFHRV